MVEGCNPVLVLSSTYFGALALYLVVFFIDMPSLVYPLWGSMMQKKRTSFDASAVRYVLLAFWLFHFTRRTLEVCFIHILEKRMSYIETVGSPIYYWFFAFWNSWAIDKKICQPVYIVFLLTGVIMFVFGEIGNFWYHLRLRFLRTRNTAKKERSEKKKVLENTNTRKIPSGGLFRFIVCPHYFYEIITWIGYFFISGTLGSLIFAICSILVIMLYSNKRYKFYVEYFNGEKGRPVFPNTFKRLIPFIY